MRFWLYYPLITNMAKADRFLTAYRMELPDCIPVWLPDAAIIFSDILLPLEKMGVGLQFMHDVLVHGVREYGRGA